MKYYGQFHPEVDRILYEKYFKDKKEKGICFECGAVDGEWLSSTKFFEETLGWNCINVEAHPESFQKLQVNRPESTNVHAALSDTGGEILFKYSPRHTLRAQIATEKEIKDKPSRSRRWTYVTVPKKTYRGIIHEYGIKHLDLLVLDVERYELAVLSDLVKCPVKPDVLCVEHHAGLDNIKALIGDFYQYDFSKRVNSFFHLTNG